jgi:ribosomal protein S18 acetylase RimI-like enzyme
MKIRLAQDKDCAAIARLHRQTIRNVNSKDYSEDIIKIWSGRTHAQKFRNSANKCKRWVAVECSKIVGFCDHNLDGEFWGLYIHKDFIGKGIGSRLLKTAETSLKKLGYKKVKLEASITARDFYKKRGYKVVKRSLHPIGDKKMPVYIMTKNLN